MPVKAFLANYTLPQSLVDQSDYLDNSELIHHTLFTHLLTTAASNSEEENTDVQVQARFLHIMPACSNIFTTVYMCRLFNAEQWKLSQGEANVASSSQPLSTGRDHTLKHDNNDRSNGW